MSEMNVILIAGANRGIGYRVARNLAKQHSNYLLIVSSRDTAEGKEAAFTLNAEGLPSATSVEIEVTSDESIAPPKPTSRRNINVSMFSSAGIALGMKDRAKYPQREMMKRIYEVNVLAAAVVTEDFIPLLERSKVPRIFFTSSTVRSLERTSDPTNPWATAQIPAYSIPPARRR
jgi:NAD(P)-dependent dehydrogenase (short-subunit alcohol dehydrogenase family)